MRLLLSWLVGVGMLSAAWSAPAWKVHLHWADGQWNVLSQEAIEADVRLPRVALGQAQRFPGLQLELFDAQGTLVYSKALHDPGHIHGNFAAQGQAESHAEVQMPTDDVWVVMPRLDGVQHLRVLRVQAVADSTAPAAGGSQAAVEADFVLEVKP